jgi:catechol 2,3-dioxygenase-like lactoylglutathione lyase family enzyme
MITGLDHIVLVTAGLEAAIAAYRTVLGCAPSWRAGKDGVATALFALDNMALEIMAPAGPGASGDRVRGVLAEHGEGLASLCFEVDDIAATRRTLERRALAPDEIAGGQSHDGGRRLSWKRVRADTDASHGIRMFFLQRDNPIPRSETIADGPVHALDHVVVSTTHPNRAAALYGARLGLDMALDRTNAKWGTRLMFFRCGDMIVEIAYRLSEPPGDAPDRFYGLSWRTADLEATRTRLATAGLDVSNIRTGRKPGTHVFTLRNGTCNVPTLFVGT